MERKNNKNKKIIIYLVLILSVSFLSHAEIKIIVNQNVKQNFISKKEIKKIFQGRQSTWDDGDNIIVVILKENKIFKEFLSTYVKTNPTQFKNVWRRLIFTGKVTSDQIQLFKSEEESIAFLLNTKNTIGFTTLEEIPSGLKIIKIRK